jgi:hypothetical protein
MLKLVGEIINNPHCREESGCLQVYASTFFYAVWIVYYLPYKFIKPLSSIQCGLFIISPTSLCTLYRRKWMHKLVGEIINNPHCIEESGCINL